LRLEPHERADDVERRATRPVEQVLPGQRGAGATTAVEDVGGDAGQYGSEDRGSFSPWLVIA
jgi:hypothetical protein